MSQACNALRECNCTHVLGSTHQMPERKLCLDFGQEPRIAAILALCLQLWRSASFCGMFCPSNLTAANGPFPAISRTVPCASTRSIALSASVLTKARRARAGNDNSNEPVPALVPLRMCFHHRRSRLMARRQGVHLFL